MYSRRAAVLSENIQFKNLSNFFPPSIVDIFFRELSYSHAHIKEKQNQINEISIRSEHFGGFKRVNKQSNPTGPWLWTERLVSPQYLACLSTSSSKDKLAFDVGLQEHSKGESRGGFDTIVLFSLLCCLVF